MDTSQFNQIFSTLERDINNLYEKVRVLEDIKSYTKEFVLKAIDERRRTIEEDLKVIEGSTDEYQNTEFIVTKVSLDNVVNNLTDRDGIPLKGLILKDNALTLPGDILDQQIVKGISNLGQVKNIKQYDDLFAEAEPFEEQQIFMDEDRVTTCSIYETDTPADGGLNVKYEIFFTEHLIDCNYLWLETMNCEISRLSIVDDIGSTHYLDTNTLYLYPDMRISKVIVILTCKHYEEQRLQMCMSETDDSFDTSIEGSVLDGN